MVGFAARVVQVASDLRSWGLRVLGELWQGTIDGFRAMKDKAIGFVVSMVTSVTEFFIHLYDNVTEHGVSWAEKFFKILAGLPALALRALATLPATVMKAVVDAVSWLYEAGKDVVQGLINGIKDGTHALLDVVRGLGHDVAQGFRDAIGSHSPSTVFAAAGQSIVDGLIMGINGNAGRASAAVAAMLSGLSGGNLIGSVSASITGSGGPVGYVPIQVNLGGRQMTTVHAALIPAAQQYKLRAGTTGLT